MALRAGHDGPLATGTSICACRATCSPPHAPIQMRRSVAAPVDEDPEQGNLRLGGPEGSPAEVDRLAVRSTQPDTPLGARLALGLHAAKCNAGTRCR